MIFSKEHDLALWLLLKSKNGKKRRVEKYIKELPDELTARIRISYTEFLDIVANKNYETKHDKSFYRVQSEIEPDIIYEFVVDGDISIYQKRITPYGEEELFSLHIGRANPERIMNKTIERCTLGSVCKGQYPTKEFKEVDSELIKTRFGYIVKNSYVYLCNYVLIPVYMPISIKKIPDELFKTEQVQRKKFLKRDK